MRVESIHCQGCAAALPEFNSGTAAHSLGYCKELSFLIGNVGTMIIVSADRALACFLG